MKSNEEFTADILAKAQKIKAKRAQTRNSLIKTGVGALALTLVLSAAFGFSGHIDRFEQNAEPLVNESSNNISLVNKGFAIIADCAYDTSKEIKSSDKNFNVSIPVGGFLDVKDTSAMSEDEVNKISYELKTKLQKLYGTDTDWHISGNSDFISSVYFATSGKLKLILPKNSDADSVVLSCTDNGNLMISDETKLSKIGYVDTIKTGSSITVTADEYKKMYGDSEGMFINWKPSDELNKILSDNTNTDLSGISDIITGTVNYTDGTSEIFTIAITFDSEGILHAYYSNKTA